MKQKLLTWLKRFGKLGFLLLFIKGLIWIALFLGAKGIILK